VQLFADAWEADDIDGIVTLLTDDAWLTMPPSPLEYQGADAIGSFLRELPTWRSAQHFRLVPTRANTQPAFGVYRTDAHPPIARASGLMVLTLEGARIATITIFTDTSVVQRFGLPRTLRT
jgi:ketosteroid isomerase-like protein